jgi:hypothetical protein
MSMSATPTEAALSASPAASSSASAIARASASARAVALATFSASKIKSCTNVHMLFARVNPSAQALQLWGLPVQSMSVEATPLSQTHCSTSGVEVVAPMTFM